MGDPALRAPLSEAIAAFVNPGAGTAGAAAEALSADPRFDVHRVAPGDLPAAIRVAVRSGARRIVVAGGDGTIGAAAHELIHRPVELAIVPAGTRNHFARTLGLSESMADALELAAGGAARAVDVGMVGDRIFLNTSSVGAYVTMVRRREKLRPSLGYHLAGFAASASLLARLRTFTLELEVEGRRGSYRTPLIFFGVGERDLRLRSFGDRVPGGPSDLHAVLVRGKGRARLLAVALATASSGIWRAARMPHVDSFLVEECIVDLSRPSVSIAVDGEIVRLRPPLRYRILRGALTVVAPRPPHPAAATDRRKPGN